MLHDILQDGGVGVYTMTNISHYQAGLYTCQASNGVGRPVTQTISLTVLCKYSTVQYSTVQYSTVQLLKLSSVL